MNLKHLFKLKSYEHVEILLRQHPIFLLRDLALFTVLAAVPVGIVFILQTVKATLLTDPISLPIVAVAGAIYYLAIWLFFFSMVIDYYLDIWVVTNDRLIAVQQQGLFSRTISEMDLWLVQDVTSEVKGISATIFGYGALSLETAGKEERFHFVNAADPSHVRQHILALAEVDRKYHIGSSTLNKVGL
jgi:membrane protein YdbS with pleckstrin-like domain